VGTLFIVAPNAGFMFEDGGVEMKMERID